jgi:hypothetical protein
MDSGGAEGEALQGIPSPKGFGPAALPPPASRPRITTPNPLPTNTPRTPPSLRVFTRSIAVLGIGIVE